MPRLAPGFDVPDRVDIDALSLRIRPDGRPPYVLDLIDWPGSLSMRRETLFAIAKRTDPGVNGWRRAQTIKQAISHVRSFVVWCEARGIESFADLTLGQYEAFEEEERGRYTAHSLLTRWKHIRAFLRATNVLPTRVAWYLKSRWRVEPEQGSKIYLSLPQFFAIEEAAMRTVSKARYRVEKAHAAVQEAQRSGAPTLRQKALLGIWEGRQDEPIEITPGTVLTGDQVRRRHLGQPSPATGNTFHGNWFTLTPEEAAAAALLLVCRTGWNRSVVDEATVGSWHLIDGSKQAVNLSLDKPRRQGRRHSTDVLVDYGQSSAGRAFATVVDATAPARAWAEYQGVQTDRLLLRGVRHRNGLPLVGRIHEGLPADDTVAAWLRTRVGIEDVTFPVLRRTHQALIAKGPAQNTQREHEITYAGASPEVRAELQEVAAAGLQRQIERAEETLQMRLAAEDEVGTEVANGSKDTGTAACRDINRNPETGEPCRASFLACLACPNAIATPRHLPRLTALHKALDDLRCNARDQVWRPWNEHYMRLTAFLFGVAGLTETTYEQHRLAATTTDHALVAAVLTGDLDA
ncbi:MAG TPA: hypothetical protein VNS81_08210 [Nocardioides sp.]|nr:hypothetical protein [Nocardioides sp.]